MHIGFCGHGHDLFSPSTICAAPAVLPLRISLIRAIVSCSSGHLLLQRVEQRAARRDAGRLRLHRGPCFCDRLVDDVEVLVERRRGPRIERLLIGARDLLHVRDCRLHLLLRLFDFASAPPPPTRASGPGDAAAGGAAGAGAGCRARTQEQQRRPDGEDQRGGEREDGNASGAPSAGGHDIGRLDASFLPETSGDLQPRAVGRRQVAADRRRRRGYARDRPAAHGTPHTSPDVPRAPRGGSLPACRQPAPGSM